MSMVVPERQEDTARLARPFFSLYSVTFWLEIL
jgi:hypothetical protein